MKGEIPFLTAIDLKILDQEGSYKTVSSLYSHLDIIYSQFLSPTVCLPYIFINVRNIVSLEISVKKHRLYPWTGRKRMKRICKRTMATLWVIFNCRKKQIFNSHSFPVCVLSPSRCDLLDYKPARLLCSWDSPGKNTGVSRHSLFWVIFPTQGSNLKCLKRNSSSSN